MGQLWHSPIQLIIESGVQLASLRLGSISKPARQLPLYLILLFELLCCSDVTFLSFHKRNLPPDRTPTGILPSFLQEIVCEDLITSGLPQNERVSSPSF